MYFDIAMPLVLFMVTLVAVLLDEKVEGKLKGAFEEKKFGVRDAILLVAAISVTVSLIVFIPQGAITIMFLFAYSMVLFMFTYLFSDFPKNKAKFFCIVFLLVSFLAAIFCLFNFGTDEMITYGAFAFFGLFGFTLVTLLYESHKASAKERWYLAVLPPALFVFLYAFFGKTPIWFPYLLNLYGIVFAVLIILYLGSLFTWKTSLIFIGLIAVMDTILVLYTRSMVSAATHVLGLRLPMLVTLPIVPIVSTEEGMLHMGLGLGDFFFAGLIGIQTMKKFSKSFAISSLIGMTASFSIFEMAMLNYGLIALPGTVMIICGWIPFGLWKVLGHLKKIKKL